MLIKFRSYQLALLSYREIKELGMPRHLKDQVLRASSSIVLNLAEGSGKDSQKDRRKFYQIALGSQRETMAVLELCDNVRPEVKEHVDQLGGAVYKLCKALE